MGARPDDLLQLPSTLPNLLEKPYNTSAKLLERGKPPTAQNGSVDTSSAGGKQGKHPYNTTKPNCRSTTRVRSRRENDGELCWATPTTAKGQTDKHRHQTCPGRKGKKGNPLARHIHDPGDKPSHPRANQTKGPKRTLAIFQPRDPLVFQSLGIILNYWV